jgi:hypothetical protein
MTSFVALRYFVFRMLTLSRQMKRNFEDGGRSRTALQKTMDGRPIKDWSLTTMSGQLF